MRNRHFFIVLVSLAIACPLRADNRYVVTQSTATDCGPAALATLLHYYLDVPATEAEMMGLAGYKKTNGTSLLGLEQAAKAKGCAADSFRMDFETLAKQLAAYPAPLLVRLLLPEPHFVAVLGIEQDYVAVADPAAGNMLIGISAFRQRWYLPQAKEGYVFVAAAPESHVNQAHRAEIMERLKRQLRNLTTSRAPLSVLRY